MSSEMEEIRNAAQDSEYARELATALRDQSLGLYLSGSLRNSPLEVFPPETFTHYFETLVQSIFPDLEREEIPPVLRLQLEQIILAHHSLGVLYSDAGDQNVNRDTRKTLITLATQLTAEFRRLSIVVQESIDRLADTKTKATIKIRKKRSQVA